MIDPASTPRKRRPSLDGLRGFAALAVVLFHAMSAFTPGAVPEQSTELPWWADSPIDVLYNGTFWVSVFFVLSGFVLAQASVKHRKHFLRDVFLRYLRLALPATASVLFAWTLLTLLPDRASRLNDVAPSPWLHWVYQGHIPSVLSALKEGLVSIFRDGFSNFNNVLWTMRIELIGSLGVYAFFQYCRTHRLLAVAGILLLLLLTTGRHQGYVGFALGAALSLLLDRGLRVSGGQAFLLAALGLLIGSEARGFALRHGFGGWPVEFQPGNPDGLAYPVGALLVVVGVLFSAPLQRFFETRACQLLGRLSFPLYLIHVPLIYTLAAAAALRFEPLSATGLAFLGISYLATAWALATLFEICIDQPVLALNKKIALGRGAFGKRPLAAPTATPVSPKARAAPDAPRRS